MNELVIAVAGARKTQSIVDACSSATPDQRIAVVTFTQASQLELESRIANAAPFGQNVEVLGWYSFLLRHFVRPYLPLKFPGRRLSGFNFPGDPGRVAGAARFLDSDDRAYQLHLAKLACEVEIASAGSVIDRLEHIYSDIYVDEAQDIGGCSLDVLEILFKSKIRMHLVGDMRQALLSTDIRDQRHAGYRLDKVINWYRLKENQKLMEIRQEATTYRSSQAIATFSDRIFDPALKYESTTSAQTAKAEHEGIFRVLPQHVREYVNSFSALCLHWRSDYGTDLGLSFVTFGVAKGRTVDHVLILPTGPIKSF